MSKNKSLDDIVFDVFKNIIIEQNKQLIKQLSQKHNLNYDEMLDKYLKPEYYLPVLLSKPPPKKH
jgi:predicted transcriptional regulator